MTWLNPGVRRAGRVYLISAQRSFCPFCDQYLQNCVCFEIEKQKGVKCVT